MGLNMAAVNDGRLAIAKSPHSERCTGTNAQGLPCKSWALKGAPTCWLHSLTEEERREQARSGGRARSRRFALAKAMRELDRRGPSVPKDEHAEALDRLEEARARLRTLHAEGRISANELPPGVLLH